MKPGFETGDSEIIIGTKENDNIHAGYSYTIRTAYGDDTIGFLLIHLQA